MLGKVAEKEEIKEEIDNRKGKVIKFGWVEGVMMRCLLNIWGTMLFLRLTWVVGQAGIRQGLLVITLCNIVTWLSALSMSAISTNGQIAAGGVYYLISRSLGPALGGSIGLMFTMANTISVGTYTVGFATSVSDLLQDAVPGWDGIVDHGCRIAGCRDNDIRIIGGPVLCIFLFLAFAGMDWVTRIQKALLVLLIFAQCDMFAGSFLDLEWGTAYVQKNSKGEVSLLSQDQRHAYGYSGWSMDTANENLNPNWEDSSLQKNPGFFDAFGVFFTAVTGIVAGANLSGDLKDPSYSIPKGTLLAIIFTYITYMYFALQTGCVFNNRASGIAEEYRYFNKRGLFFDPETELPKFEDPFNPGKNIELPKWVDCSVNASAYRDYLKETALPELDAMYNTTDGWVSLTNEYDKWNTAKADDGECTFGSGQNQMTMTYISFTGWLRYAGGFSERYVCHCHLVLSGPKGAFTIIGLSSVPFVILICQAHPSICCVVHSIKFWQGCFLQIVPVSRCIHRAINPFWQFYVLSWIKRIFKFREFGFRIEEESTLVEVSVFFSNTTCTIIKDTSSLKSKIHVGYICEDDGQECSLRNGIRGIFQISRQICTSYNTSYCCKEHTEGIKEPWIFLERAVFPVWIQIFVCCVHAPA
jgi:hypothetical protein